MLGKHIYLLDFEAYRPPEEMELSMSYTKQFEIASNVSREL